MLLYIFLIGTSLTVATDEFRSFVHQGEIALNDEAFLMRIVPSGYSPQKLQKQAKIQFFISKENENYKLFNNYVEKGVTMKGLTFNIYDDNMRQAAVTLFRLLQSVESEEFEKIKEWARQNVNDDMFEYAWRLVSLYNNKFGQRELDPPFVMKPNYFINSETILKAFQLKANNGNFNRQEAKVNQYYKTDDIIAINTNYSNWNSMQSECDDKLNYFTEDISLNSFYYGVHLLHPFWMSNDELDEINPRHAEHYYYIHQQLMARYLLEKEHLKNLYNYSKQHCRTDYNPYLIYDNGLPFAIRSSIKGEFTEEKARIKSIDIAIKECISRGLIIMENGTTIKMSEHNNINLLSKLIRANLDGVKAAKIIRSIFGYGRNGYPVDKYNPAPSVLHHPETSLREPIYWHMIQYILNYFTEYKNSLQPYDLSKYETEDFNIISSNFTKIITYFDFYQFNINKAVESDDYNYVKSPLIFTARQKRLRYSPFVLNFTVECKYDKEAVVRLFLGPRCLENYCWEQFSRFYELDSYKFHFKEGQNVLNWSPDTSIRFSSDDYFNLEKALPKENKYNLFKYPLHLLIPKGSEEGLNLTVFIMITSTENLTQTDITQKSNFYNDILYEVDSKPLGFPFHRQANVIHDSSSNYKFYNISIFHKKHFVDNSGYFSSHLY